MGELEPSSDGCCGHWIVFPDLLWRIVAGNYDLLWSEFGCSSFAFGCKCIVIGPSLKVLAEMFISVVEIVKDYHIFVFICTPPFVEWFVIDVWVVFSYLPALACARSSVIPFVSKFSKWLWFTSNCLVEFYSSSDLDIVSYMDVTSFESLFSSLFD